MSRGKEIFFASQCRVINVFFNNTSQLFNHDRFVLWSQQLRPYPSHEASWPLSSTSGAHDPNGSSRSPRMANHR